ncbi:MAG: cadherin-like beta sandwich domain-containing protein [Thermoleophilia bacterium]
MPNPTLRADRAFGGRRARIAAVLIACAVLAAAGADMASAAFAPAQTITTVGAGSYTVPSGVSVLRVEAFGASGGFSGGGVSGSKGATVTAYLAVSAGNVLAYNVGGAGRSAINSQTGGAGGDNGGAAGGNGTTAGGGGGGGATDVKIGGVFAVVAGGGGGYSGSNIAGGQGGVPIGSGGSGVGGGGATQSMGGSAGGTGTAGQNAGGASIKSGGAGAGGSAYGGGGGGGGLASGGGGGSGVGNFSGGGGGGGSSLGPAVSGDPFWAGTATTYGVDAAGTGNYGPDSGTWNGKLVITPMPKQPTQVDVSPSYSTLTTTITPATDGGTAGSYKVYAYPSGGGPSAGTCLIDAADSPLTCRVQNLTNGTAYDVKVEVYTGPLAAGRGSTTGIVAGPWTYGPVTVDASSVATLSGLSLAGGGSPVTLTPTFASGTSTYTASVDNSVTSVTVTPTKGQTNQTVRVNGSFIANNNPSVTVNLAVGDTTITTLVTAQDGTTLQTYTVVVTRAASGGGGGSGGGGSGGGTSGGGSSGGGSSGSSSASGASTTTGTTTKNPDGSGSSATSGTGPSPTLRVTSATTEGYAIVTEVVAGAPGAITTVGTVPSGAIAGTRRACGSRLKVKRAGRYSVLCTLSTAAQATLVHTSLRVTVTTTLTNARGAKTSKRTVVTFAARGPGASSVTG